MAINYNSINFKNKDVDKFSTKFGSSNGDPKNNGTRQEKKQVRKDEKTLNKSLNEGIEKQKVDKSVKTISYRGVPVKETTSEKQPKDWRERSRVGAALHGTPYAGKKDTGGKKNMSTATPKKNKGISIIPKSCRGPKEWTR
jgi:hypothetical protein